MYNQLKQFKERFTDSIKSSDKVVIVPHVYPDFDAIGSALGVATICESLNAKSYILVNENFLSLDPKIYEIMQETSKDFNFINLDEYLKIAGDNDLLVATDVNKANIVHVEKYLDKFKDIYIIDHHLIDEYTINTNPKNMYIEAFSSSACELVTNLLLEYGINFDAKIATYLYSGIILDTNHFMKSTTSSTLITAAELLKRGANTERANYLLKSNNIQNLKIYKLINSAQFYNYNLGLVGIAKEDKQIYEVKEIAIASDKILNGELAYNDSFKNLSIENLNVSFAMGPIDRNNYRISARSTEDGIDVCEVMRKFGGGGNSRSAACEISKNSAEKVLVKLREFFRK